jgi:hypothetical protein
MKRSSIIAILSLFFVPAAAHQAQQRGEDPARKPSVVGVWQGRMDELPAVDLTIREDGSGLAGTVVFYRVTDEGNGPKVTGKAELALIDPRFDGSTLLFSFKRKDGAVLKAEMKLVGNDDAVLKPLDDPSAGEAMTVKMVRKK